MLVARPCICDIVGVLCASVTEVSPEGELSESTVPVSVFCNRAQAEGEDLERVSTGTKFALELWLRTLAARCEKS